MSIYQRLYWPPQPVEATINVLENFKSIAERFEYYGESSFDLLFDSKNALLEQKLPSFHVLNSTSSVTSDVTPTTFAEAITSIRKCLKAGAMDQHNVDGSVSLEFRWTEDGTNYFDSIGQSKKYSISWKTFNHRSCKRPYYKLSVDPCRKTHGTLDSYIQAMDDLLKPFDYKFQSRATRRVNLDVSFYHPNGGWIDWHTYIFGKENGTSTKCKYDEKDDGSWNGDSGGISLEISEDEAFEFAIKAYEATIENRQEHTNRFIKVSCDNWINQYGNDKYFTYMNNAISSLPEKWNHYQIEGGYFLKDLYDLEFSRDALTKQNPHSYRYQPYTEIYLGTFEHTNDDDPHKDLRARGDVIGIVTENKIGIALNLKMPPLPKALASVFGDDLVEIGIGEIPGFKKGERKRRSKKST